MGIRGFLVDVHDRADVDRDIVRRVGVLVVSGWIGGFAWHLAQARLSEVQKFVYSAVLFIVGLALLAGMEYAAAVGDAFAERHSTEE